MPQAKKQITAVNDSVSNAITTLEGIYRRKIYLGRLPLDIPKEPDPVNDNEEVIINYSELSDTLATEEANRLCLDSNNIKTANYQEVYCKALERYECLILKHKRKIDA